MKKTPEKSNLGDLLLILRRNILDSIKKEGFRHELTLSQIEVLRFIGLSGKETMKSIATYLKVSPPSATETINEMEKRGLINRETIKSDKRVVLISLTIAAKKLYISVSKRKNDVLKKMISKLEEPDKKNLERIIRVLITK
ncbi:MAG: MarR family transcriptional regulator [bacterium]